MTTQKGDTLYLVSLLFIFGLALFLSQQDFHIK